MNIRHVNTRLFLLPILAFWLSSSILHAQGFVRQYPFFTWDQGGGQTIFPQADGSFRLTATEYPDFGTDLRLHTLETDAQGYLQQSNALLTPYSGTSYYGTEVFLLENGGYVQTSVLDSSLTLERFAADGSLEWSTTHIFNLFNQARSITVGANTAEEIFVRGYGFDNNNQPDETGFILKFAADGNLLWERFYGSDLAYVIPASLVPTPDGGCLFNNWGQELPDTAVENVLRFDGDGNYLWHYSPEPDRLWPHFAGKVFDGNAAGETYLFSSKQNPPQGPIYLRLDKLALDGQLLDSINLNNLLNLNLGEGKLLFATADGGAVIIAERYLLNSWVNYIARISADGSLAWQRPVPFLSDAFPAKFADGKELSDGSLVLYAYQGADLFFMKFSAEGVIYPHTLNGIVARDSTFNCALDSFDPPLKDWVVRATKNSMVRYAQTDADGQYSISDIDTGSYEIVLIPPSYLWDPCLDTVQRTFAGTTPTTDTLDFPVQSLYDCPLMEVDIATPFLRRCFQNKYALKYCNTGNQAAEPATVTVLLDPLLQLDSASIPYTQDGQLLTFDLGTVPAGECGNFFLYTTPDCNAVLGQTLCVEAHIYPDTICAPNLPNWSGAQIEVSSECAGDSVLFKIQNTGNAAMQQMLDFIIVDDHVITRQGMFQLPAGGIHEESVPASGSTWRLIAQQVPGFPFGPQSPTVGVEACLANPVGNFSMGMLNMFPNFSGNPFHDTDCRTVIGAFDPNDKQALPIGVDAPHFIDQNQPLEYLIRFQNTGTDTAFTVVLRDTLSPWLDPATIRPGAASHPYSWQLSGAGILTVTFADIMLPDSNVNEPASHGFVQFRIDQRRDNPLGTIIENQAAIYFDFNAPVITNTVFHTVGEKYLLTAAPEPSAAPTQLRLWPNPATQRTTVQLDGLHIQGRRLLLRDVSGRLVREWPVQNLRQEIPRAGVQAGMYWLELRDQKQLIAVGKLIWMD